MSTHRFHGLVLVQKTTNSQRETAESIKAPTMETIHLIWSFFPMDSTNFMHEAYQIAFRAENSSLSTSFPNPRKAIHYLLHPTPRAETES